MHVCHVTTVHPAKDPRIFYRMGCGLARCGVDVTLIAPATFCEESLLRPSSWNVRLGKARRATRIAIALRAALDEAADLYHFHDPELIPMALALKLMRPWARVVYDVHEDYPSMMMHKYWLPKWLRPWAAVGIKRANALAAKFLDGIVVADPGVAAEFKPLAPHKTQIYYNYPSLAVFAEACPGPCGKSVDLVYLGGMSRRAGIFVLFEALKLLADEGVEPSVRLGGYTDGEQGLTLIREEIHRLGLEPQIQLDGRIPHKQVPGWIASGAVGLVLLQADPKFMKNIPSKMFEYWACGLPVLASDLPPARQFVREGKNGYLFSPGNPRQLAERITHLLLHSAEREAMGRAGRRAVEEGWNNECQIGGLLSFYEKITVGRATPPCHSANGRLDGEQVYDCPPANFGEKDFSRREANLAGKVFPSQT
jgi:glycosyltransferase involved in cell wall biosynthesis